MRFFLSLIILFFISYTGRSQQIAINILDSNSVKSFIKNSTTCEQIQAAIKFTSYISGEKGFGIKILQILSKSTGYRFFLPITNGGVLLTNTQRINELKEQLEEVQKKIKCNLPLTDTLINQ